MNKKFSKMGKETLKKFDENSEVVYVDCFTIEGELRKHYYDVIDASINDESEKVEIISYNA